MSQTYTRRSHSEELAQPSRSVSQAQGMSNSAMQSGSTPSASAMGRSVSMPASLRQRMENSFGADFSGVKFFESQQVADNGADAVTLGGGNVGFAPGKLDFSSKQGQELIGHELAHVVSHARGEVTGSGFLGNASLEAQADRQGEMAAAGQSVYSGPVTPLSASTVASAEGPMQAKKNKTQLDKINSTATPDMSKYKPGQFQANQSVMDRFRAGGELRNTNGKEYDEMMAPIFNPLNAAKGEYLQSLEKNGLDYSKASQNMQTYRADALGTVKYNAESLAASKGMMGIMAEHMATPEAQEALRQIAEAHNNNWDAKLATTQGGNTQENREMYLMKAILSKGLGTVPKELVKERAGKEGAAQFLFSGMTAQLGAAEGLHTRMSQGNEIPDELKGLVDSYGPLREVMLQGLRAGMGGGQAAPFVPGEKTSNQTFGYRSDEIGALAQGNDYDPAAENGDLIGMRKLYDKIKNPGANDTEEQISARKRFFAEQRAAQMDSEYRKQNPPTSPAPAAPKKKWYQFWK
ncbi:MAG: DUF4157 domain-containing protein [Oscillospiraceae bacterium]